MKRLPYLLLVWLMVACSSIDCPVNSLVVTYYEIYDETGELLKMSDTLTVTSTRSDGLDTVLLNKGIGVSDFLLPISYSHPEDVLVFDIYNDSVATTDTVWIKKDDIPHFESVDCNASFFHEITSVRYTRNGIDSIVINNPSVTYDNTVVHFRLYPKSGE